MQLKILSLKHGIALIALLFFFSLFGAEAYQGSLAYYFAFDISWLLILLSTFCFSQSYVIFYIQLMLFLGFWVKLMSHLILGVMFVEPTGYWVSSVATSESWDHVLLVSCLAACGILLANLLFFLVTKNKAKEQNTPNIPQWYIKHHNLVWNIILCLGLLTNIINIFCHIYTTGLRPQIVLPFHLNALFSWIMVIIIPLSMATFLGWDSDLKLKQRRYYWVFFLASLTSLSVLSRAIYLFWTIPFFFSILSKSNFSLKKISFWQNRNAIFVYLTFAALTLILVNIIRVHYYIGVSTRSSSELSAVVATEQHKQKFQQIKKLFVGRWVGLEAVMATTAFPEADWNFFKKSIMEKPSVGDIGIYTNTILKPNNYHNNKKTMFSSLPGLVGILNYAHSKNLIFWGMFCIGFLLCNIERIIFLILKNKFLLSQQGVILGYWCVSGLNIPYLGVINLLECFSVFLILTLLAPCYNWIMKYSIKKSLLSPT